MIAKPEEHSAASAAYTSLKRIINCGRLRLPAVILVLALAAGALVMPSLSQAQSFQHPGALNNQTDLDRMKTKVAASAQPWKGSWDILVSNTDGWGNHNPEAVATVIAGSSSEGGENYMRLARDAARAYQLALRYHGDGSTWAANKAVQIMNAWASTHTGWSGDTNVSLRAGIYGYQFASAAELMRGYSGWTSTDFTNFKNYMLNQFYPLNDDFLVRRHGTVATHYWANWDLANVASIMAIAVLTDDRSMFDRMVDYFYNGIGYANINKAVTYVHPNGLGQWQESGRDQGHSAIGPQLTGVICEIAWNQGVDLYGAVNNRFLSSVEYISKYNLMNDVPFSPYVRDYGHPTSPQRTVYWNISDWGRPTIRTGWELVYNHYVNRRGLSAPYTKEGAEQVRPEGGGFNYGDTSGGFDALGFTTLTHSRDPIASDVAPSGLRATQEYDRRITLSWWGSARAMSYNVKRSTTSGGPYTIIAAVGTKDLFHVDTGLTAGRTYYYVVSANTPSGETANSDQTSAIAVAPGGISYQAENAAYGEGAELITWTTNHNGTGSVVPHSGYVEFTGVDGGDGGRTTLAMRYAHGGPNRTGVWTVNGVQQNVLTYSTGDWDMWTERFVTVPLNSGTNNTIRIESDGTDAYVYIDELTVKPTGTSPDQWRYISNRSSEKYLRVEDSSTSDGAYIIQEDHLPGYWSQQFKLNAVGDYFHIQNRNSGKCLRAENGSTASGTPMVQETCNVDYWSQQFDLIEEDGYYRIMNRNSSLYLRVENGSSSNGARIVQEPLDTTYWSQQWLLE